MRPSAEVDGRASYGSKLQTPTTAFPPERASRSRTLNPLTLGLLVALAACSKDAIPTSVSGPEQNRLVADVLVRPTEAVLPPDETLQLSAIVKGARGQTVRGRTVTWSSSDERVAYVDADGNIVASDEGTATITANVQGVRGKATIDVRGEVVDILVDNPLTNLAEGDVERLTATYVFANGARRPAGYLRWRTSNPRILTIDGDGDATARNAGDVTVTAEGRGVSAAKGGNVGKGKVASVTVYASATQIEVGEQSLVWAEILNDKGQKMSRKPTWSSSDPAIVSVDAAGNIQGHSVGTATITATTGGKSGSIDIGVVDPMSSAPPPPPAPDQVTDLSVAEAGETNIVLRFTEVDDGTGAPSDYEVRYAEGTSFVWDDGLDVTKGSCASPVQGQNVAATRDCSVDGLNADTDYAFQLVAFRTDNGDKVYGPLSNQTTGRTDEAPLIVDVTPSSFQVDVNATKQLTAKVTDSYGNPVNEPVTWTSNKPAVASVDNAGLSTGKSGGNALIKAATASGAFDTSDGTVNDSGGGGGGGGGGGNGPPPNMNQVTERFFNAPGEDGWGNNSGGKNRYVSDPSAPVDAPTILEMPFGPCSNCGGSAMGNQIVKNFDQTGQELWVEFHVRYSPNWEGNPSGVNKIMYLARSGSMNMPVYLAAYGIGQNSLTFQARQQGQDSSPCGHNPTRNIKPNQGSGKIVRGQWQKVEVYLKLNTRSGGPTCDGLIQIWIDGVLTHDYSDVHYLDHTTSASDWNWYRLNYAPVWGGGKGDIPAEQSLFTAHLKASVK